MAKNHRKSRRNTCKARKSRKSRRNNRSSRRSRRCGMWGGAATPLGGAPLGGNVSSQLSLAQGTDFLEKAHMPRAQAGGAYGNYSGNGAPVGDQGMLPQELRDTARISPLDKNLSEISGMSDNGSSGPAAPMTGGGRRRRGRKAGKSRKGKKARKGSRKSRKGSRRQRGGAFGNYSGSGSPLSAQNMLLGSQEATKAGTADFSNPLLKD